MTIEEAFVELENYVDASDPDMDSVSVALPLSSATVLLVRSSFTSRYRILILTPL
jgi:hypothetical protein